MKITLGLIAPGDFKCTESASLVLLLSFAFVYGVVYRIPKVVLRLDYMENADIFFVAATLLLAIWTQLLNVRVMDSIARYRFAHLDRLMRKRNLVRIVFIFNSSLIVFVLAYSASSSFSVEFLKFFIPTVRSILFSGTLSAITMGLFILWQTYFLFSVPNAISCYPSGIRKVINRLRNPQRFLTPAAICLCIILVGNGFTLVFFLRSSYQMWTIIGTIFGCIEFLYGLD